MIYRPDMFLEKEKITMCDAENYYDTYLERKVDGYTVFLTGSLMECMALHGKVDDILYLKGKYPLLDANGWTSLMEREIRSKHDGMFCGMSRAGGRGLEKEGRIGIVMALAFSDVEDVEEFEKLYRLMPLTADEKEWIYKHADNYTKYRLAYFQNQIMERKKNGEERVL